MKLLRCAQGSPTAASESTNDDDVAPQIASSRSLQDVHRLAEGFCALWDLDQQALGEVVGEGQANMAHSELWPFQFFLEVVQDALFGNRARALDKVLRRKSALTTPDQGLLGALVDCAEALVHLMQGSYAKAIKVTDRDSADAVGMMATIKVVALIAQGNLEAAQRFGRRRTQGWDSSVTPHAVIHTILAASASVENGQPLTTDLRSRMEDDGGLFSVLPLMFLGVDADEIQRSLGLSDLQLQRLTSVHRPNQGVARALPQLTEREREIIRGLAEGASRKALAERFFVSMNTIKTHIAASYRKLGATNRGEALQEAARRGYL